MKIPKRPTRIKIKKLRCPECRSTNMIKNGHQIIDRKKKQRYRCNNCYRNTTKPLGLTLIEVEDKKQ